MRVDLQTTNEKLMRLMAGPARLRDSVVLIAFALTVAAVIFGLLYDRFDGALRRWTERDLSRRAALIASALDSHSSDRSTRELDRVLDTMSMRDDTGLLACTASGALLGRASLATSASCGSPIIRDARRRTMTRGAFGSRSMIITAHPMRHDSVLYVLQDTTFLDSRRKHVLEVMFVGAEIALLAFLLLARMAARMASRRTEEEVITAIHQIRNGSGAEGAVPAALRLLVRDMQDSAAQPVAPEPTGVDRLRELVVRAIPSGGLVVMANREPYSHEQRADGGVSVQRPASGLVTGIEPILRACGGTWIAYGSGSADRAHSDASGRVAVPPDAPEYSLRRLWIDEDEYERYYSGFANEGLWPLCHMAHAQPAFRGADWSAYQAVNQTFARAAIEETSADGLLLIQDYHFALVPRMLREAAPHIITSIFWHIPWPNSEVVGICPWKERLLEGMIGADIVGFHTRQYCINFLETVQRYLECRVDFEEMSVTFGGHRTLVRPYPISVEWPYPAAPRFEGVALRSALGISADAHVTVGVDRADYTKGLLERIEAVETLLSQNPSLRGEWVLVQLASPTRTRIRRYQELATEVMEAAARVNARFETETWSPILLQMRTFSPDEVRKYYAMADSALVTPLHDGMNLVAKEYVSACEDGNGVLVLSTFAGAAKELEGALIVNPYDAEQVAESILRAVRMPVAERRARMEAMRTQIASHSIYDWSENLLRDMCDARQHAARFWPQRTEYPGPIEGVIAG